MNVQVPTPPVESSINQDVIDAIFHVSEVTQHLLDAMRGAEEVMSTMDLTSLGAAVLNRLHRDAHHEDCSDICNDCLEEERQSRR
jgi:hypothetical protein